MDKIKKYIDRFLASNKRNRNYDMDAMELIYLAEASKINPIDTVSTTFDYGYVKRYRAAMAEMKKRGVA